MDSFENWDSPRRSSKFDLTHIGDLLKEPTIDHQWIVDGLLLKGGLSLLCGKPKSGKSTLSRCLAIAVARGDPFLGRSVSGGPVALLALEDHRAMLRDAFGKLGSSGGESLFIHCGSIPGNPIRQLENVIEKYRPVLVVIDTLFRFTRCFDVNSYTSVLEALTPISDIARKHSIHILAVHHAGKAERSDSLDSVLGSVAVHGSMDATILVTRKGKRRTIQTQQRYGRDMDETQLEFNSENGVSCLGESVEEIFEQRVSSAIVEALSFREQLTEPEIDDLVKGATALKRKTLRVLVAEEEILRDGAGERNDPFRYRLNRNKKTSYVGIKDKFPEIKVN